MDLIAQPTLGTDAEAVAHDQHADHQLRIDRGAADPAVVRLEMLAHTGQVDEAVHRAQQMVHGDVPVEVEAVE
jgi:hypothetical protein